MAVPRIDLLDGSLLPENGPSHLVASDQSARVKILNAGDSFGLAEAAADVDNVANAARTVLLPVLSHGGCDAPRVPLHVVHFDALSRARCENVPILVVDESWVHS